jgi:hypothetical protein
VSRPAWRIRPARKRDRALLEAFACADQAVPWEAEVEDYVRGKLIDWAFEPLAEAKDPRVLLVFDRQTRELVGVAAHERTTLQHGADPPFPATKLEVVAIARAWQGRRFASGERVSDVMMAAVMTDISDRVPRRDERVFAVVHEKNVRSIGLCRRHGFIQELSRPHPAYRRLVTEHRRP